MDKLTIKLFFLLILLSILFANEKVNKAEALINQEKYNEAIEILLKVIDDDDENHKAFYLLGKSYFKLEDYENAVEYLEEATDLYELDYNYFNLYGEALFRNINNVSVFGLPFAGKAIKNAFQKSLELEADNTRGQIGIAKFYTVAPSIFGGDRELALEFAKKIIVKDEVMGTEIIFRIYYRDDNYEKAEQELMKLKKLTGNISKHFDFYNSYGYNLLGEEKIDLALEKFKQQIILVPKNANAYDSLAEGYLKQKNYEEAKKNYAKSFQLDPSLKNEDTKSRILDLDSAFGPYLKELFN